jgi:ornithine cyclodeaminase/alanine dehydrogenase-like protein (mu-crystallin family)
VLILSRTDVRALLDVDALIEGLAEGFVQLSRGEASAPPRGAAFTADGFLGGMPGYVPGALGAKLVTLFAQAEPAHKALIVLFDEHDGTPLAVMDGTEITAVRTAAASAVAARELSRADALVLAVVGASVQGESHARVLPRVREFGEIRIASRSESRAAELAEAVGGRALPVEEAVRGADVVCLCTDADQPVLDPAWLAPGAHVGSVGYGRELPVELAQRGPLVVESRVAFDPPPAGAFELQGLDPDAAAELGEVVAGARAGRSDAEEVTVYKSMGHAIEDVVAGRLVYDAALAAGRGARIDIA